MRRRILYILAIPALHVIWTGITGLVGQQSLLQMLARILFEWLALATLPQALINGYFPSALDLVRPSVVQFAVMILTLVLWFTTAAALLSFVGGRLRPTLARFPRIAALLISIAVIAALLSNLPPPPASLPAEAVVRVDLSRQIVEMSAMHRAFSQGGEAQMPQVGYFEQAMQRLAPLEPRLIRIDHIYDYYDVVQVGADGVISYDWSGLDRIIDAIVEAGAEPFISLSYMPAALARDGVYGLPKDWQDWANLVYETVRHYNIERGLGIRYWEVWNEPNLPYFWSGTIDEYADLYEHAALAVRRADASAWVGGPATSSQNNNPLAAEFLERNWFRALLKRVEAHDLPLDFVSWHHYTEHPEHLISNTREHQSWVQGITPAPQLLMTEWNHDGAFNIAYDIGMTNAYVAASIHALLSTDLEYAFYFEPIDGTRQGDERGGWGMLHVDGQPKPVFEAMNLVKQLSGVRLHAESSHPHIGVLAAEGDGRRILLWHYGTSASSIPVTLYLEGLPAGSEVAFRAALLNAGQSLVTSEGALSNTGELSYELQPHALLLIEVT